MRGRAVVRRLSRSYAEAATRAHYDPQTHIDAAMAEVQHRGVAEALEWLGDQVRWLDSPDDQPDAVFVEDAAVVVGSRALVTRSAHPGRAPEAPAVARALAEEGLEVHTMAEGVLDGGDVLRVGNRMWVGGSSRSDGGGLEALRRAFPELEVHPVVLPEGVLHLKCVASTPGDDETVVLAEGTVPPETFAGCRVVKVPAEEAYAANVVGNGSRVLVAAGHPRAAEALKAAGFEVRAVPVGELRKGDGSLTCLSLRW